MEWEHGGDRVATLPAAGGLASEAAFRVSCWYGNTSATMVEPVDGPVPQPQVGGRGRAHCA